MLLPVTGQLPGGRQQAQRELQHCCRARSVWHALAETWLAWRPRGRQLHLQMDLCHRMGALLLEALL